MSEIGSRLVDKVIGCLKKFGFPDEEIFDVL